MKPRFNFRDEDTGTRGAICSFLIFALVAWGLLSATFSGTFAAESQSRVKTAQEMLKREQYLFEEPTGTLDDPTRAALRRFQIRHSLPPTEEIDPETWQALQQTGAPLAVAAPAPVENADAQKTPIPGVPASTVESDQQFLKQVQASGGPAASEASTPTPAQPAPAGQLAPPPIETASAGRNYKIKKPLPPIAAAPKTGGSEDDSQSEKPKGSVKRHQVAARDLAAEPVPSEGEKTVSSATEEQAHEQSPSVRGPAVISKSMRDQTAESDVDVQKSTVPDKRRQVATQDVESSSQGSGDESIPPRRVREPYSNSVPEPDRRSRVVTSTPSDVPAAPAENDIPQNAPPGSRITTYTTRTTGPDGRTTVERRTVVTPPATEYAPVIRRVEPVDRSREGGFFHRLFRGD